MIIFIIIASISNSIMDTLKDHYEISIFKKYKYQNWWNPNISWRNHHSENKLIEVVLSTVLVPFTDAWHLFKMIDIICMILAIISYRPIINAYFDIVICYLVRCITFELFYGYAWTTKTQYN